MPQRMEESPVLPGRDEENHQTSTGDSRIQIPGLPANNRLRYFGDYELIEEIARGGMGVVYKARQVSLNRIVAVKMILAGQLASAADVQRFRTEAEAAANLQHPNIVGIYEVGERDGQQYFSMNYVEGRNLAEAIRTTPVSARQAAAIVKTLATAIQYAHQRGILHRDLKPQNVIMDAEGQPHITDFGLAKRMELDGGLTQSGAVLGSPNYMSPEQAAGRQDLLGPASDVYSLGAILYELLTGRAPFRGETPIATLEKVRLEEPIAPTKVNAKTPADLETLCLKCLEKQPERRFASARLLAEDLERFLNHEPILTRPATRTRKTWNWFQRHPWTVAAILTGLILGVTCLSYGFWQQIRYMKWTAQHPMQLPYKGLDWLLLTFFFFFWSLAFLGAKSEMQFRRSYRERKVKGLPMPPSELAWRGTVGLSVLCYGLLLVLKGVEIIVWQGDPISGLLATFGFLACWAGASTGWTVLGLVKGSVFESVVEKSFDRVEARPVPFRRNLKDGKVSPVLRNMLNITGWTVGVWLTFGTIRAIRDQWELEGYRRHLRANPPQVSWLSWSAPSPSKIPDELNFAKTPLVEALAYETRVDTNVWSELKLLRRTLIHTNDTDWGNFGSPSNGRRMTLQRSDVAFAPSAINPPPSAGRSPQPALALMHRWEPQLAELRQASMRPYARLELEVPVVRRFSFLNLFGVAWTNAPAYRGLSVLTEASLIHGVAALSDSRPQDAFADVAIIFKLADCLKDHANFPSTGYRAFVNVLGAGLVWEGFVRHLWSEKHLLMLQNQLQSIDLIGEIDAAFRTHEWLNLFQTMNRNAALDQVMSPILSACLGSGVLHQRWMRDFVFTSYDLKQRLIVPRRTEANGAAFRRDSKHIYEKNWPVAWMFVQHFPRILHLVARRQSTIHLATIACALERYQKSSGRYPERLEELVPEFIQKMPHEVVNGQPFQYRLLEDGTFKLYSVGWDERDDGGVASTEKNGRETGDWVWFFAAVESK